jgi:hypothetical protein
MTGVQQYFQANMSVPVEVFDPAAEIDVSGLDPDDQQEIGESGADFAVAVGLAETLLNPNAFRLEVLTAKEKAKRHFLSRTIWAVGAAVVALVFVVLLFKDRADAIRRVREANAALEDIKKGNKQRFDIQTKTVADELDARSKEVAIRARRMSSAFFYEVVRAVLETHNEFTAKDDESHKGVFLTTVAQETTKVHLDLDGNATDASRVGTAEGEAFLKQQNIWPRIRIEGQLKPDTPDPGGTFQNYTTALRLSMGSVVAEGRRVDVKTNALDARNAFQIDFLPKPAAKPEEK